MKTLSLALAATFGLSATPATAAVLSVGSPLAHDCYSLAEARDSGSAALDTCNRALLQPLDVENRSATLVNRGVIRMRHSDYRGADADFDAAIALQPSLSDAWLNKGFLRLRDGDGSAALPLIDKALALNVRRPALGYLARGLAHEQAGQIDAAYADLRRARAIEPKWQMPAQELARYRVVER